MKGCKCDQNNEVPNFTQVGFDKASQQPLALEVKPPPNLTAEGVEALALSACVGASYDKSSNKICFKIPIYGDICIVSPIPIPVGGSLKACAQTINDR